VEGRPPVLPFALLVCIVRRHHRGWPRVGDKVGRIPVMWFLDPGGCFALMRAATPTCSDRLLAVTVAISWLGFHHLVSAAGVLPGRVGLVAGILAFSFGPGSWAPRRWSQSPTSPSSRRSSLLTPFLLLLVLLTASCPCQPGEPTNLH